MRYYLLHLLRTWPWGNGLSPRSQKLGFQKWVQISGYSESGVAFSIIRANKSSCPGCSVSNISPVDTPIFNSNSRCFPSEMRMISLNIPTQSWSRHPRKGFRPEISKLNQRFVILLDTGIVPRTMLISRRTSGGAAFRGAFRGFLQLIMMQRQNTCRFERLLRFTSPARETCLAG